MTMENKEGLMWQHPYKYAKKYSKRVAYMCMEFGIDQSLKIYSGGLGYLAGSHMRSAALLKQNVIGIGMLWRYGYYDQIRDRQGNMSVLYRRKFYTFLQDPGILVPVTIKGYQVMVKALYLPPHIFGTVPMYFLTTDIPENDPLSRSITTRLYHSNDATRVAQNIVLGVGGAKVVERLGGTDLYHINEAHALPVAFYLYNKYGNVDDVKKRLVFTTHTPEKAGNAVRSIYLLNDMGFFCGTELEEARRLTGMYSHDFEYTPSALRMAGIANGVSELHGHVARDMWKEYKGICEIKSITNAQDEVYWKDEALYEAMKKKDDKALLARKKALKKELFQEVADQEGDLFDVNVLTIVWARRFAAYKRADLIARDYERLLRIVESHEMPVQVIWAGKPYPEDMDAINQFNELSERTYKHPRITVLTGYELHLSKLLKQGADIWLNTPRRPQEASGTSGMTAAMNGAINVSTFDGWIPEFLRHGKNGFTIPPAELTTSLYEQDLHDQNHLMDMLEFTIVPMYYKKQEEWIKIMKNSMRDVVPKFDSKRMAQEYYELLFNQV